MKRQTAALTRVTASVWGSTLQKAREVYTAVVRPAMVYGSTIWHRYDKARTNPKLVKILEKQQNQCLRVVAGAYKATAKADLEDETYVISMDLYLDGLLAHSKCRTNLEVNQVI